MPERDLLIRLSRISLVLSILIFLNILFGPLVRATNSGLACPDWPLCYGKVIPPAEFRIWMEVGHRIYSAILSILFVYMLVMIFRSELLRKSYAFLGISAAAVLIFQIALGALTVTKLLDPGTVNSHLLNAVLFLLLNVTVFLKSRVQIGSPHFAGIGFAEIFSKENIMLKIGFVLIYLQLFMGGRVSSNYAGMACIDWPMCNGKWFPEMKGLIRYQMEHRYLAYIIMAFLLILFIQAFHKKHNTLYKRLCTLMLYIGGVQIAAGVFNVLWSLPILLTAFHTGNGVMLLTVMYVTYYVKESRLG